MSREGREPGTKNLFNYITKMWPRQESNLDLELRKLLYYPLYYEAKKGGQR